MRENEIRPKDLWDQYKVLCEKDNARIFGGCERKAINCLACQGSSTEKVFQKDGFAYFVCRDCETLFLNPRPLSKYFDEFYANGESVKYWSEVFYPTVEKQRKTKIYGPRVEQIKDRLKKNGHNLPVSLVDIGSGYGSFLEEVRDRGLSKYPLGIEPNHELAGICQDKGFKVYESTLENIVDFDECCDVVTSFEVLEHLYNPRIFVKKAYDLLKPRGTLLMTSLSGTGYDIQMLGKDHDNVKPPHHINFFNPRSSEIFFLACGFSKVRIETPGKLDVDILCNRVKEFPYLLNDELFKAIYDGPESLKNSFQSFLVKNNLSSHMWIWAEK